MLKLGQPGIIPSSVDASPKFSTHLITDCLKNYCKVRILREKNIYLLITPDVILQFLLYQLQIQISWPNRRHKHSHWFWLIHALKLSGTMRWISILMLVTFIRHPKGIDVLILLIWTHQGWPVEVSSRVIQVHLVLLD